MKTFRVLFLTVGWLAMQSAGAALVTLVDPGSTFSVTYDDSATGLFGPPTLAANTLRFNPAGFQVQASGPAKTVIQSSTIVMTLNLHERHEFEQIQLIERGNYQLNSVSFASLKVSGMIRAEDTADPAGTGTTAFIDTTGPFINDNRVHDWEAGAALVRQAGAWFRARELRFTLENILTAQALQESDLASIDKREIGGESVTLRIATIPLPPAMLLWLAGAALLIRVSRRD